MYNKFKALLENPHGIIHIGALYSILNIVYMLLVLPHEMLKSQWALFSILVTLAVALLGMPIASSFSKFKYIVLLSAVALNDWAIVSSNDLSSLLVLAMLLPFATMWNNAKRFSVALIYMAVGFLVHLSILAMQDRLFVNDIGIDLVVFGGCILYLSVDRFWREKIYAHAEERQLAELEIERVRSELAAAEESFEMFIERFIVQFKEPVNVIQGINNILQFNDTNIMRLDYLKRQFMTGQYLLDVFDQLIANGSKKTPDINIAKDPFSLDDIVMVIENRLGLARSDMQIEAEVIFNDNVKQNLLGDKFRLLQIILSLIDSALRKVDAGNHLSVTIAAETIALSDNINLQFSVYHNGHASHDDPEEIPKGLTSGYFERMFKTLGYDLNFSALLIEQMNSNLEIIEGIDEGEGSLYTFKLVLPAAEPDFENSFFAKKNDEYDWYGALRDLNILVVDDSEDTRFVVKELLELAGALVTTENDGDQAVIKVLDGQNRYDCVIMDLQMPNMNGLDATRAIRQEYTKYQLPIIGLSINGFEREIAECLDAGMNHFAIKPFNINAFIDFMHGARKEIRAYNKNDGKEEQGVTSLRLVNIPEGYDVNLALANLGGDEELYLSILESTLEEWTMNMNQLQAALKRNDVHYAQHVIARFANHASLLGAVELDNYLRQLNFSLGLRSLDRGDGEDYDFKDLAKEIEEHIWQTITILKSIGESM